MARIGGNCHQKLEPVAEKARKGARFLQFWPQSYGTEVCIPLPGHVEENSMRSLLGAVMAISFSLPALTQEAPRLFPARDVAVTYRVSGAGPMQEVTMAWAAAPRLMRVELPGMGYTIADFAGQNGFMVMQMPQPMVMDIPMAQAAAHVRALESARFTRLGADRVAGIACTNWRHEGPQGSGTGCFTEDGVMLRSQGSAPGVQGALEALRVTYGPQEIARFQRPAGAPSMQMPGGMLPGLPPAAKK
jgi:hypothetical protein